jgi:hypothetical protein
MNQKIAPESIVLYHDGCRLCMSVVEGIQSIFNYDKRDLVIVNLEENKDLTAQAIKAGVRMLPSLVIGEKVLEITPHAHAEEFLP